MTWSLDREGHFTASEGGGLSMLGLEPGEVVGASVYDVYAGQPQILRNIEQALMGRRVVSRLEVHGIIFDAVYYPLRGPDGAIVGSGGVAAPLSGSAMDGQGAQVIPAVGLMQRRFRKTLNFRLRNHLQGLQGLLDVYAGAASADDRDLWRDAGKKLRSIALAYGVLGVCDAETIPVDELVSVVCHSAQAEFAGRVIVDCPSHDSVSVGEADALALALMIHEAMEQCLEWCGPANSDCRIRVNLGIGAGRVQLVFEGRKNQSAPSPPLSSVQGIDLLQALLPMGGSIAAEQTEGSLLLRLSLPLGHSPT